MVVPIHSAGPSTTRQATWAGVEDFHVEAADRWEAEFELAARGRVPRGFVGPPAGEAVDGGEGGVHLGGVRGSDADAVQDVGHFYSLGRWACWMVSARRLMRCRRASQVEPTVASWVAARASRMVSMR
jgi:hypothetical protein